MHYPDSLKYTKEHEWAKVEGNNITIGITDHAQSALGDVVFVELPKVDRVLKVGETFGVVESIKAVSDLFSPVAGRVVKINSTLLEDPAIVNRDPHGQAWMIQVELQGDPSDASSGVKQLLDSQAYSQFVANIK